MLAQPDMAMACLLGPAYVEQVAPMPTAWAHWPQAGEGLWQESYLFPPFVTSLLVPSHLEQEA